ncbi:MAG TPA: tRNA (N6-isopentenyl adenosine(37)-C2)-methylthiotransferase MiaB [Syntrophomonadaceae bacterium]|nr:tRNA (N6-isopentenyl adenosine(37)-C2)-methylthiotransferase MiaB [Syntrophomonadaceae bacterium]
MSISLQHNTVNQKYHILTYGCQMNVRDSETIAGLLESMGYSETGNTNDADIVVFNTCSIRHSAENKVYGRLGQINKMKQSRPELMIVFGGCMAQLPEVKKRLKRLGVDVLFGTHNIHELPYLIEESISSEKRVYQVWENAGPVIELLPSKRQAGLTAYVNIMYGCNNFCSYCIVPYTRGRERSRSPEHIIDEVKQLANQGYKEITLLGQNVNSYGKGLDKSFDFADLLEMVVENSDGIDRIRFMTSHPKDVSDKLIDTIARGGKVCEHVHVALQSGSNKILGQMNRKYTREHYIDLTKKMRDKIPNVAISTDIIVGFPGETDEDFEQTLELVEKIKIDAAYTFMYSPRSGTRAADFKNQIRLEVKKKRLARLMEVQYEIAAHINKALEGNIEEVLVEGPSKNNPNMLTSRTRNNRIVIFSGPNSLIGQLINVRIVEGKTFSLLGEYI